MQQRGQILSKLTRDAQGEKLNSILPPADTESLA